MGKTTVAQLILDTLTRRGVRYVFGVPGRSVHVLADALATQDVGSRDGIRFIVGRHEGASAFMADGYARASGLIGTCLVTSGPGATNAATGVLCAQADKSPLLLLSGECMTRDFARGAFQCGVGPDADIVAMFAAITRRSELVVDASRAEEVLTGAIDAALSRPAGAVHVSIPMDVMSSEVEPLRENSAAPPRAMPCDEDRVALAFQDLIRAQRPLLLLGSGCVDAIANPLDTVGSDELLRALTEDLVERHQIPVATTPRAKGLFPEDHPLSLRTIGMAGSEWTVRYLRQQELWPEVAPYDALLVVGSGLKQWATGGFDRSLVPRGPFHQIDVDRGVFQRAFPEGRGTLGHSVPVLQRLAELGRATTPSPETSVRGRFISDCIKAVPAWLDDAARSSDAHPVLPQRVMQELQRVIDAEGALDRALNIFCDIGNATGWTWHHLGIRPPHRIFYNTGMGSMGWASGAVIGGQLGDASRTALAVSGDGAFFMNGSEVSTACQYSIPAVWLVLQDDGMNMVSHGMSATHGQPAAKSWENLYRLGDGDLVGFAASLGADAYGVSAPGELESLLPGVIRAGELRRRPQVIVVRIDGSARPPFPHLRPAPLP